LYGNVVIGYEVQVLWETERCRVQWLDPSSRIEDFAKRNGSASINGTQQTRRWEDLCVWSVEEYLI
jgi:hypothetical protein